MLGTHKGNSRLESVVTRERFHGSDTEFCAWLRACKELPSFSSDFGVVASDNDVTIHRYMHAVDGVGTRDVQSIMQLEIKTRRGKPHESQMDTLSKLNLFAGEREVSGNHIRFFGLFLLVLSDTTPDNSGGMWWGVIPKGICVSDATMLKWTRIDRDVLIKLLRFDLHPVNFSTQPFRRHHKTREIIVIERTALGFDIERPITKRS